MRPAEDLRRYIRLACQALTPEVRLSRGIDAVPPELKRPTGVARFFLGKSARPRQESVDHVKHVARFVAQQYRMDLPQIAVRFAHLVGRAGQIHRQGALWYVDVADTFSGDDAQLVSILAHEMAHVVLFSNDVQLAETDENERLTDATAAMAGFGRLMIQAHEVRKRVRTAWILESDVTVRIGYLHPTELLYLSATRDRIRSGEGVRLLGRLSPDRTVRCWACDTRLSFKRARGRTTIACPTCSMRQRLNVGVERPHVLAKLGRWIDERRGLVEPPRVVTS